MQGVDGALTHNGMHRYAFDFDMPIGTPVLATRDGVVLAINDGFPEGSSEESSVDRSDGSFVLHGDGTVAGYGHLSVGVCGAEGESVREGQLLGLSGHSGNTKGPHLHFQVNTRHRGAGFESIPIAFVGGTVPVVGRSYGPYAERKERVGE